jgi:hypothetical protein
MATARGIGLNRWFQESLKPCTGQRAATEPKALTDLKALKLQGQGNFELDNLTEGLEVLQQYYQGCFYSPIVVGRFGKSLPAVGRSKLMVNEKKLPKAQRLSKTLPQLVSELCTD